MDDAVASLVTVSADATDSVVVARAANAVSAPMDELYGLYDPTVPPEVLVLDYLGREVVLDVKQADFSGATAHVDAVGAAWGVLRPSLVSAGGTAEAANYDASLALLRADITAADATRLETDAQAGLELVDAMEGVFATAEQPD